MAYYKYRNFNNIERFLDIIKNKRLYCSLASELNDPFEWYFESERIISLEEKEKTILIRKIHTFAVCPKHLQIM